MPAKPPKGAPAPAKRERGREPAPVGPGPWRMCQISRARRRPEELVRLVMEPSAAGPEVRVDVWGRGGGRGCWILPTPEIVARAEAKPGAILRQLRGDPRATVRGLAGMIRAAAAARLVVRLREAARSGQCRSGAAEVEAEISAKLSAKISSENMEKVEEGDTPLPDAGAAAGVLIWVVAVDAGAAIRARLRETGRPCVGVGLDRAALGRCVGRGPRATIGLCAGRSAEDALRWLPQLGELR